MQSIIPQSKFGDIVRGSMPFFVVQILVLLSKQGKYRLSKKLSKEGKVK